MMIKKYFLPIAFTVLCTLSINAQDDPFKESFLKMDQAGVAQVRIVPATGAEKFSELVYKKVNEFVQKETEGRVKVVSVEFMENHKNSAIYQE